jgi:hypothetical protein
MLYGMVLPYAVPVAGRERVLALLVPPHHVLTLYRLVISDSLVHFFTPSCLASPRLAMGRSKASNHHHMWN